MPRYANPSPFSRQPKKGNDIYVPPNPFSALMKSLFLDEETADLLLEVGEGEEKCQYFAHYIILKQCAPDLASLCYGCDKSEPLHLPDVDHEVFLELLRYVYGKKVAEDKWKGRHQDFIDAADKYGVVHLKLMAEARYVKEDKINVDNVVDKLLYADSKNCALLKEQAILFIMNNAKVVLNSESFKSFPKSESIIKEIFTIAGIVAQPPALQEAEYMVDWLRKQLSEEGLDVDGSREVLIARLEDGGDE